MSTARVQPDSKPVFGVHPPPSPNRFVETMQAYQRTAALKAAIDFDLFTVIGEGVETAEQLAQRNHASVRGMRVLCDFLVIMGFLNKAENCYTLTNESATFLDKNSLAYVGSATRFLGSEMVTGAYSDFAAVVRAGGPPTPRPAFHSEHPIWVEFARSMAPLSHFVAQQAERVLHTNTAIKVLDVTASHGLFGIVIARNNPQANIVALDWPTVLNVAQENAERFGVADRYALLPGDVFDVTYGHDYDLILVPNILHMWDRTTIQKFLEKAH